MDSIHPLLQVNVLIDTFFLCTCTVYPTGSHYLTLNMKLKVGDEVWVETLETYVYNYGLNVFSGSIIHVDF